MRPFQQIFILLLVAFVGLNLFGPEVVWATGSFDIPNVDDEFNEYRHNPQSKPNTPTQPKIEEKQSLWDKITGTVKSAWDWTKDKASSAWEWTKEKASALWDWFEGVISKITEVVIDALTAAWDWIKANYKEILVALLIIILVIVAVVLIVKASAFIAAGSAITFLGMTIAPEVLSFIGYGILIGGGFNGLLSWLSGNEFMSMEMLTDILFGCIAGGFGGAAGAYAGGARVVAWLGKKFPRLSRLFPTLAEGSVGAGVEQSVFDLLKNGKIDIKKTLVAFGVGGLLSFGGWYFFDNFGSIANAIGKVELPYVQMRVVESADGGLKFPAFDVGTTKLKILRLALG